MINGWWEWLLLASRCFSSGAATITRVIAVKSSTSSDEANRSHNPKAKKNENQQPPAEGARPLSGATLIPPALLVGADWEKLLWTMTKKMGWEEQLLI
ncbi:MAG: hypothetical protein WCB15_04175 [Desulfobacterales bacterium]